ncbi:putative holin-like toxin [uncultured Dialister sp.]|nr:putative holin-like toxin [uncultured Dialister sp.]
MSQELYQAFMVIINFAALVVAIIALVKSSN